MPELPKYEAVIGLEVHIQLLTAGKLFCGDSTRFGNTPNTNVSAVSLAHPGTLPVLNERALDLALKLGLALGCTISKKNYFDRKNYFYPDLPKGFQVTQQATPICLGGRVHISAGSKERAIKLNRIHLEEDAGKSIHDAEEDFTCIDLNRAGVPLLELVSEPDIYSAEEAGEFLTEIRKIVRFLEVCDGNMEEGSMRCDANISLRAAGEKKLGTRIEVKNLNSIKNVKRAIDYEIDRLTRQLQNGEEIVQETRSFEAETGITFALRSKEEANDYRYFPEPDLPPFIITEEKLAEIKAMMPELPAAMEARLIQDFSLTPESVKVICADRDTAAYFQEGACFTRNYKTLANWMIGPVKSYLNECGKDITQFSVSPQRLAQMADLIEEGKVNFGTAVSKIFPVLLSSEEKEPLQIAQDMNLTVLSDESDLNIWIEETLASMPDKVTAYRKGKKNLIGVFAGDIRRKSKGKADMAAVNKLLIKKLNQ